MQLNALFLLLALTVTSVFGAGHQHHRQPSQDIPESSQCGRDPTPEEIEEQTVRDVSFYVDFVQKAARADVEGMRTLCRQHENMCVNEKFSLYETINLIENARVWRKAFITDGFNMNDFIKNGGQLPEELNVPEINQRLKQAQKSMGMLKQNVDKSLKDIVDVYNAIARAINEKLGLDKLPLADIQPSGRIEMEPIPETPEHQEQPFDDVQAPKSRRNRNFTRPFGCCWFAFCSGGYCPLLCGRSHRCYRWMSWMCRRDRRSMRLWLLWSSRTLC